MAITLRAPSARSAFGRAPPTEVPCSRARSSAGRQRLSALHPFRGLGQLGQRRGVAGPGLVAGGRRLEVEGADAVGSRLQQEGQDMKVRAGTGAAMLDHPAPPGVGRCVGHAAGDLPGARRDLAAPERQFGAGTATRRRDSAGSCARRRRPSPFRGRSAGRRPPDRPRRAARPTRRRRGVRPSSSEVVIDFAGSHRGRQHCEAGLDDLGLQGAARRVFVETAPPPPGRPPRRRCLGPRLGRPPRPCGR